MWCDSHGRKCGFLLGCYLYSRRLLEASTEGVSDDELAASSEASAHDENLDENAPMGTLMIIDILYFERCAAIIFTTLCTN